MIDALNRRKLLAGAGISFLLPAGVRAATSRKQLTLELVARDLALRPGQPVTPVWRFAGDAPQFAQGDEVDVTVVNRLPIGVLITWRGLDGAAALEPVAHGPIAAGASARYVLALAHAGTLQCDARLGSATAALPLPILPLVVAEKAPVEIDRDQVLLIEDWRLRSDGSALPPGTDPAATPAIYTVNEQTAFRIDAQPNERLRLRFINGSQRSVIAIQLQALEVRIIAIDGQPSEPFAAREGRMVLAPGTRIDAIMDLSLAGRHAITLIDGERIVTLGEINVAGTQKRPQPLAPARALSSNGLPEKLPLQSALRIDLQLDGNAGWVGAAATNAATPSAFRAKRGRTVVLALSNPTAATIVFHLHGHHMRLLDRLDDGWKPFWLDTVAVPAKQTVRMAFGATHPGTFLMEMAGTAWTSPKLLRSYGVDG